MNLTPEGVAMARELEYGHNPTAYSCGERANNAPFDSDAVCIICSDGFEAMLWKRRAVKAEAQLRRRPVAYRVAGLAGLVRPEDVDAVYADTGDTP